jgi:hypothetical protein
MKKWRHKLYRALDFILDLMASRRRPPRRTR